MAKVSKNLPKYIIVAPVLRGDMEAMKYVTSKTPDGVEVFLVGEDEDFIKRDSGIPIKMYDSKDEALKECSYGCEVWYAGVYEYIVNFLRKVDAPPLKD